MRRLTILLLLAMMAIGQSMAKPVVMSSLAIPADTTRYGEDTEEDENGTATQGNTHVARDLVVDGYNAINDVMEGRYVPVGETFLNTPKWLRNLYVQGGVGLEQINPPTNDYKISLMRYVQLGIGKDLNHLHAVRAMFHSAWGHQQYKELTLTKYGLKVEHLYNLSSYMSGFNPTRLMSLSTILGVGAQYSKMQLDDSGMSFEGHFGLQFRFFTGPKAYMSIEPYVGIGGDKMDVSGNRNWRKADIFYGANVNFVYYINNNLSPESKRRLLGTQSARNRMSVDSLMEKWQQPWFVQLSTGAAMMQDQPNLSMSKTLGSEVTLTAGRWLSPVAGFRGSIYSRANVWRKETQDVLGQNSKTVYQLDMHNVTLGGRFEAMFNPLGFLKNFYWDAPLGFYLVGGVELGWLLKSQAEVLSCSTIGWGGGINLWYQMTPGMKVFVEPRFMHNDYKIPYTNVEWVKRYSDNYISVNLGMAVELRDDQRYYEHSYEEEFVNDRLRKIKVGLAGGTHFLQTERGSTSDIGIGYNGMVYGEYSFDRLKSARVGVEFVNFQRLNLTPYIDYNMDYPEAGNAPVERNGLINHKYSFFLITTSGMADLNYLTMHYQPQKFRLYAFGGPTFVYVMKYTQQLSNLERLMLNHAVEPKEASKVGFGIGAHLGLKMEYRITNRISAVFIPTLYMLGTTKMPGIEFTKLKLINTFNLGAQYSF